MEYKSSFGKWEERASVRVKPRRVLDGALEGITFFPPELVPAASHPLIEGAGQPGARHRLLLQQLYNYLCFTTDLETAAVIPVVARIGSGSSGLDLPPSMESDAFKISTDEAWHAQFSRDLVDQLEAHTGVARLRVGAPAFLGRLRGIRMTSERHLRGVDDLLFAVVSETLVSTLLSDLPKDRRLPRPVREVVADHAEDEGRHHAYFRDFLRYLWSALDARQRSAAGVLAPRLIRAFLEPDYTFLGAALLDIGLTRDEVAQVLVESYPADRLALDIRQASRATVRYFKEVGAVRDPATGDAFQEAGLL
ncbi:diiron oxygenase [Actinacidiphila glaucinigra]|uniref:diiron oxygenase n=1 Tax=Actinacidiphila glaucinigra TaxID=235986 RepID=UPI002DDB5FE5|nr:diiron oxygenase [Actinacidiphila glaucinigra]WSD65066.1 diiron oxygenase [Actinacidiphila glaucinigra]